jgi:type VII secretion-associated serine protease mycosin
LVNRTGGGAVGRALVVAVAAALTGPVLAAPAAPVWPGAPALPAAPVAPRAPSVADQWHLEALKVAEAHRVSTGTGVVVAVIDSGVGQHPDLAGQVLPGHSFVGRPDQWQVDGAAHGTGVAGLVVAKGGGAGRALGIAPGARILPIKVTGSAQGEPGNVRDIGAAIRWAADNGAKVINLSMSVTLAIDSVLESTYTLADLYADVRYAMDRDVVLVAAAGNAGRSPLPVEMADAPAGIPGVLGVAATDRGGTVWAGSRQGRQVGLAAPGVEIPVVSPAFGGNPPGYAVVPGGTSAATPLVAGAAALVRARYPQLRAADVIQRLIATADEAGPAGRDDGYGFGRLNLVRALTAEVAPVAANPLGTPTSPPTPPRVAGPGSDGGLSATTLVIAGAGVVGCLAVVAALAFGLFLALRRRRPA